jgi:hypothetical protein
MCVTCFKKNSYDTPCECNLIRLNLMVRRDYVRKLFLGFVFYDRIASQFWRSNDIKMIMCGDFKKVRDLSCRYTCLKIEETHGTNQL